MNVTHTPTSETDTGRVDYRKFMEWVGLSGTRPSSTSMAMYLDIELGNREEVDAVEAAVILEAITALRSRDALVEACAGVWAHLADSDDPELLKIANECRAAITIATGA